MAFNESVYATYQRDGPQQAMQQFMQLIGAEGGPQPAEADMAALGAHADRLVLGGGVDSRQQNLAPYRPNTVLADRLGLDIESFPGGHNGYRTHPDTFADRLSELLA